MNAFTNFAASLGAALAVLLCTLLVFGIDPSMPEGGGSSDHAGPVPAGVTKIADDRYFIAADADIGVQDVCLGTDSYGAFATQVAKIPGGTFAECVAEQNWNQRDAGTEDISYFQAMVNIAKTPYLIGVAALLLVGVGVLTVFGYMDDRDERRKRKQARASLQQSARELMAAWDKDEINYVTYTSKMDDLYAKGLSPDWNNSKKGS